MVYKEIKDLIETYNRIFDQLNIQYVLINHEDKGKDYNGELWIYHEECESPNEGYYLTWASMEEDEMNDFIKDSIAHYTSFILDRYKKGIHVAVIRMVEYLSDASGIDIKLNPEKFI